MFLAFFHVVLCVTLSFPSSSPSSLSRQLPSAVRAAALLREPRNAECNSNSKRSEGEGAGVGMVGGAWSTRPTTPPVSSLVTCVASLWRFPLFAVHKVKTKTVNIKRSSQLALSTFHCTVVRWPIRNALDDGRRDRDYSGRGRWESSQSYLNVTWSCISVSPSAVATTTSMADLQLRCKNLQKKVNW